ncbi:ubiquinol oxidase subunit II, cyanide insensitive [Pigmentiphaga litoralis]|uniref:cytochrome d ubiquinol oxidase subunit II n=1 Tax=Pigmentiphaga litoralis TaxID=516702 RepID=UPI00167A0CAC|nr:cytochrome d ubiquinol oxidase subunit II [Pigmentiphaga litoralis]GGX19693.1 ubiquinol oxidase subunit II, cyanide insensitive [Pigmentiphaga litoralis]
MQFDLTIIWALLIVTAVFIYVVLDGFDLGIGILFRRFPVGPERDTAMNSIAPVWDGNETWLVLGGGGLLAAFPLAYGLIFSALYAPIIAMLLALVFRGVAFEFRWRDPAHRGVWDLAFSGGSLLAAFSQGVVLGALLQGITVKDRAYAGGWWDWLTPFTMITGASVVIAYALLGATWLVMKTEGQLQQQARALAWPLGVAALVAIAAVSATTPFLKASYFDNWLRWPDMLAVAPVPVLVALASVAFARTLKAGREAAPFLLTLGIYFLCFTGLCISVFPYVVPGAVTIWEAATDPQSQVFMLWGIVIVLPMILGYTAWSYWVFRGKVDADGYHA